MSNEEEREEEEAVVFNSHEIIASLRTLLDGT